MSINLEIWLPSLTLDTTPTHSETIVLANIECSDALSNITFFAKRNRLQTQYFFPSVLVCNVPTEALCTLELTRNLLKIKGVREHSK